MRRLDDDTTRRLEVTTGCDDCMKQLGVGDVWMLANGDDLMYLVVVLGGTWWYLVFVLAMRWWVEEGGSADLRRRVACGLNERVGNRNGRKRFSRSDHRKRLTAPIHDWSCAGIPRGLYRARAGAVRRGAQPSTTTRQCCSRYAEQEYRARQSAHTCAESCRDAESADVQRSVQFGTMAANVVNVTSV